MKTLTIALAQMNLEIGQPAKNLDRARDAMAHAKLHGADVIVLPELWSSAYDLEHAATYASAVDAGMFAEIAHAAHDHQIAVAGSLLELDGGRIFNTATLFDAQGHLTGAYRKLHLVPMLEEDRYLAGGDATPILDAPWGKCALAVCYDLRFPELWRHYALGGASLVFLPAEWPQERIGHWRKLLPARAIENQVFIAAVNRAGTSKGVKFGGHSMVVDPWGDTVAEGKQGDDFLIVQIDLEMVDKVRVQVPVFRNRRPDVYAKWEHE